MEERRRLFHRQFPDMRITSYYLRLVYSKAGIKKKLIRQGKDTTPQLLERIREQAIEAN